jgi:head-tail adaptor
MAINVGALNERIQVYIMHTYNDTMGGVGQTETLEATTWAMVKEKVQDMAQGDGRVEFIKTYEITVRTRINWGTTYTGGPWYPLCRRIVYRGRDLRVKGSIALDKEFVMLTCQEK